MLDLTGGRVAALPATAGDRLALVDARVWTDDFETVQLTLIEIGADDRVVRSTAFEPEDIELAASRCAPALPRSKRS